MNQIALLMKLNVISAYENGKNEPNIPTLKHIADIFNTSVDYVIGYTDICQPLDKITQLTLTEDACSLLNGFRSLPIKQKHIALGVILGLNAAI